MSWPIVQLKDCARIVGGATPKSEVADYWDGDIPWTTPKDLSDLDGKFLTDTPRKITEQGLRNCSSELLPPNSVLFSSRAPIGHVAINTVPMATNQGFKSMVPGPQLDASFLYWWLKCHRSQLEKLGNGATFKEVSKAVVERIEVPLPPIAEQKRIAAILDQADELRRKRQRALKRLNQLGQAIFIEMFGAFQDDFGVWPTQRLETLVNDAKIGIVRSANEIAEDKPVEYLRMDSIDMFGGLRLDGLKRTDVSDLERSKYDLRVGDLLFNTRNSKELVGKTAVIRTPFGGVYNNNILRIRFSNEMTADFLDAFLRTRKGQAALGAIKSGTTSVFAIYQKSLLALDVPVPPIDLQKRYSNRLQVLFLLRKKHADAVLEASRLFSSLQDSAFRGVL